MEMELYAPRVRGEKATPGRMSDNPLDLIAEDHMREREVCALIDKMVASPPLQEGDLEQILGFLETQLPQHLQDEELDLFPLMLMRCDPDDEIDKVISKLHADHGHAAADAPAIAAIIHSVDDAGRGLSEAECSQLSEFARHSRSHLILENAIVFPIARARLTKTDLDVMKRHMLARRAPVTPKGQPDAS